MFSRCGRGRKLMVADHGRTPTARRDAAIEVSSSRQGEPGARIRTAATPMTSKAPPSTPRTWRSSVSEPLSQGDQLTDGAVRPKRSFKTLVTPRPGSLFRYEDITRPCRLVAGRTSSAVNNAALARDRDEAKIPDDVHGGPAPDAWPATAVICKPSGPPPAPNGCTSTAPL